MAGSCLSLVQEAKVTLYSTPRKAVTGNNGEAFFANVERGEHKIIIAYKGQVGEQKVNLKGDVEEFAFIIQIKTTNPFTSPAVVLLVSLLILTVASLAFWIVRLKKEKLPA